MTVNSAIDPHMSHHETEDAHKENHHGKGDSQMEHQLQHDHNMGHQIVVDPNIDHHLDENSHLIEDHESNSGVGEASPLASPPAEEVEPQRHEEHHFSDPNQEYQGPESRESPTPETPEEVEPGFRRTEVMKNDGLVGKFSHNFHCIIKLI